jgi:hypothetical protein
MMMAGLSVATIEALNKIGAPNATVAAADLGIEKHGEARSRDIMVPTLRDP